jgi:hypothetical protein
LASNVIIQLPFHAVGGQESCPDRVLVDED